MDVEGGKELDRWSHSANGRLVLMKPVENKTEGRSKTTRGHGAGTKQNERKALDLGISQTWIPH